MSNSLVRKGLELMGCEKSIKQERKKRKHIKYKGTLDLIPPKYRILSKNDKTDLGTILGRSSKVTVYETQKKLATQKDSTDKNIQKLLILSNNRIDPNTTNKLLERALKKKYIPEVKKPKESETTAFTEEDFKKFEKEYMDQ
ncbi:active regulator of SIRT1 [Apis cerana]|uniref:Active regulator of SIRT1 n=1 Tax=Apis cerana cerana TaxID=94128 RepID=A0A2A3EQN0_APICC|nr:active regulator of SIRT1 [Apis cerana]XP_016916459.1 active regulator of SIRT1 [Apis cerana]XP_061935633.1 active regulator of SIRT1 [Apis cerana]PBC34017.1 Active regulator of SIRT1 [Apis cerana cerana]